MTAGRKPPKPGWADFKHRFDALSEDDRRRLLDLAEVMAITTTAEAPQQGAAEPPATDYPTRHGRSINVETPDRVVLTLEDDVLKLRIRAEIVDSCLTAASDEATTFAAEDLVSCVDDFLKVWEAVVTAVSSNDEGMRQ